MEFTSFIIINLILGFVCADFALIRYLGFGKNFEIKTGVTYRWDYFIYFDISLCLL